MKQQKIERRRAKLPPILEIDEDGIPVAEPQVWSRPRWTSDEEPTGFQLDEWPADFDD